MAAEGLPSLLTIILIILAMVFARTAAMAFNRVADWDFDRHNPRTAARHQLLTKRGAILLTFSSASLFVLTTFFINSLCLALSPVALFIIFLYSITKRFTHFTQLFLGFALAVAPMGAWLAVTGEWTWLPIPLVVAVLFWVAGFDIIYATQDVEFDRKAGLHGMVAWLGIPAALRTAAVFHIVTAVALALFGVITDLGWIYQLAVLLITALLVYEHIKARNHQDLGSLNDAFFKANAVVGLVFLAGVSLSIFI